MTPPRVNLVIRTSQGEEKIAARVVADRLYSLQAALLHVGDYLTGNDFRQRGGSSGVVRQKCTLFVSSVSVGSFSASLDLAPQLPTADGEPSLGEASVSKLHELISSIESPAGIESRVDEAITDPRHRTRIMKDLIEIWPDEREGLSVEMAIQGQAPRPLTQIGRLVIEGLLARQRDAEEASVKGILGTAHVTPGEKYIRITGPDGRITCRMTSEQQESASRLLGHPAIVYGQAEFDIAGNIKEIASVDRIEPFRSLTIQRLFSGEEELVLRNPVSVAIDYREDQWVAENEELGILAMDEDYDDCLGSFQDEFFFAWKEYGTADETTLTAGARDLKLALRSLVLGERT